MSKYYIAYKERLNMPVVAEVVTREQPEQLREQSIQLLRASDPRCIEMAEQNIKK